MPRSSHSHSTFRTCCAARECQPRTCHSGKMADPAASLPPEPKECQAQTWHSLVKRPIRRRPGPRTQRMPTAPHTFGTLWQNGRSGCEFARRPQSLPNPLPGLADSRADAPCGSAKYLNGTHLHAGSMPRRRMSSSSRYLHLQARESYLVPTVLRRDAMSLLFSSRRSASGCHVPDAPASSSLPPRPPRQKGRRSVQDTASPRGSVGTRGLFFRVVSRGSRAVRT